MPPLDYSSSPTHWVQGAVTSEDQEELPPVQLTGTSAAAIIEALVKLGLVKEAD